MISGNLVEAINLLTAEILLVATRISNEEKSPVLNADESDAAIAYGNKVLTKLREMRVVLEQITAGGYYG